MPGALDLLQAVGKTLASRSDAGRPQTGQAIGALMDGSTARADLSSPEVSAYEAGWVDGAPSEGETLGPARVAPSAPPPPKISWLRKAAVLPIIGVLTAVPGAAHATPWLTIRGHAAPLIHLTPLTFVLLVAAIVLLDANLGRLAEWIVPTQMGSDAHNQDVNDDISGWSLPRAVFNFSLGAASEEYLYRGLAFSAATAALTFILPLGPAVALGALLSSLAFVRGHDYGASTPRLIGGLLYAGAVALTGSLLLTIVAHFTYNILQYLVLRVQD